MARLGRTFPISAHKGYQGRAGIYFNRSLSKSVTDTLTLSEIFAKTLGRTLTETAISISETFGKLTNKLLKEFLIPTDYGAVYESNIGSVMGGLTYDGIYWGAQTFTPSTSHSITGVEFLLDKTNSPGTVTVSIRATSSGKPTGSDLISTTFSGNSLSTSQQWLLVPFTSSLALTGGTTYAIVVRAPSGDGSDYVSFFDNTGYSNGQVYNSSDSGSTWTAQGVSFIFREFGQTLFVKQPSKSLLETFSPTEVFSIIKTYVRSYIDTFSLFDTINKLAARVLSDTITISEIFSSSKTKVQTFVDSLSLSETFITLKNFYRTLADTVTLTENFAKAAVHLYYQTLTDTFSLVESFTRKTAKTLAEVFSFNEAFATSKVYLRSIADTFSISEAFTTGKMYIRTLLDSFTITDTIRRLVTKAFKDIFNLVENFTMHLNGILQWFSKRIKGIQTWANRTKGSWTGTARTKPSNSFWTKRNRP